MTSDDVCTLLLEKLICCLSGVGRGMLACNGRSLDLSEVDFGDWLSLNNCTIMI